MRDFISMLDTDKAFIEDALELSASFKRSNPSKPLEGKAVSLIFEKPSTRTRVSFEVAVFELGGHGVYIDTKGSQLGRGEPLKDTARVLSRYTHAIVIRTYEQERIYEIARYSSVPVINALSNEEHPCQTVADLFTIKEYLHRLSGVKLAYVGDGNNVCNSLIVGAAMMGMDVRVATPKGFEPSKPYVKRAVELAKRYGGSFLLTEDPKEAVKDADVVYTDVWASMGQEDEAEFREKIFKPYQVNEELMRYAKYDALFMHCLPAHRGQEVTDEVIEGSHSVVWEQAENRLHTAKAILSMLVRG